MALDVYYREDVARILESANIANSGPTALIAQKIAEAERDNKNLDLKEITETINVYRQGFNDALSAVAAAFGVK